MNSLFQQFGVKAPNRVFLAVILGALAGISYSMLIPLVLAGISPEPGALNRAGESTYRLWSLEVSHVRFAGAFFALCGIILLARTTSQLLLIRVSIETTASLRLKLYERLLRAPIATLDEVGLPRINAILTDDVRRVVMGARMLPDVLVNLITMLGMLAFLYLLSEAVFWFVLKAIVLGALTYQLPVMLANRGFRRSRVITDSLHEGIRGLVLGMKELKLDARRRAAFRTEILEHGELRLAASDREAFSTLALATNYGDLISFVVIGAVAFVFINYHSLDVAQLTGVVMALLYLASPVAILLNAAPQIALGKVSLDRIENLTGKLAPESHSEQVHPTPAWTSLRFAGIAYQHRQVGDSAFTVGPVDFELRRGSITFIVGGNGSGKSTLSKMVSLHYRPSRGEIWFDDQRVDDRNLESWRQEIAAIYSDYYLFDRLFGDLPEQTLARAEGYLQELGLAGKVSIRDGRFSTLALSDGQRRRLALLVAFLDDKNLYLFDEWAADQDPAFKDIFYRRLLPDLKARGKCVVAISHDDRYFDVADQVLEMESGVLKFVRTPLHERAATTCARSHAEAPSLAAGLHARPAPGPIAESPSV